MPVLDGLAAARLIRELEHGGTIHGRLWIIALTADVSNENEERCRHAGMDSFLGKPVKLQGIVSKQSFSVSSTHHSIRDSRCHRGVITSIVESVAAFIFPNSRLVSFALILKQTYHSWSPLIVAFEIAAGLQGAAVGPGRGQRSQVMVQQRCWPVVEYASSY